MITIKNRLDFIIREETKTKSIVSLLPKKKIETKVKDITSVKEKSSKVREQNIETMVSDNIEKKIKPLKNLVSIKKKTVWL
jgi:hypothetical protein